MNAIEANKTSTAQQQVQKKQQPFFNKDGQVGFFSKSGKSFQAFFNNTGIQTKLTIGKPNDKYEKEADATADKVIRKLNDPAATNIVFPAVSENTVQTKCSQCEHEEKLQKKEEQFSEIDTEIQQKPIFESNGEQPENQVQAKFETTPIVQKAAISEATDKEIQEKEEEVSEEAPQLQKKEKEKSPEEEPPIQLKEEEQTLPEVQAKSEESPTSSNLESQLNSSKGGGSPLPSAIQESMGSAMEADFSGVRVHTDSNAVQMNQDLGAQAFTHGSDIYFNEGKYNTNTTSGNHLFAHELTHTVQQGASKPKVQSKEELPKATDLSKPGDKLDITHRFQLTDAWASYLDGQYTKGKRKLEVDVKIGNRYVGTLEVSKTTRNIDGKLAKYELVSGSLKRYLDISGWHFLDPLRQAGVHPILVLKPFKDKQQTKAFLSIRTGETANLVELADTQGIIKGLNSQLEAMKLLGINPLKIPNGGIENTFENGRLLFQVTTMSTMVDGYLKAGGGLGITGDEFTFNLNTDISVAGLAEGELTIARGKEGKLSGKGTIQANIANVQATITAEYIDGVVTIQGTGQISSEKFSGSITLLVTDEARSKQMMHAALGTETMDGEKEKAKSPAPTQTKKVKKTPQNQLLAGWGEVQATITPWLEGTAKIGIDAKGHVTIVGKVAVPNEVELMEQRGKKVQLFDVEIRAGYGIPLVGQVFLFAGVGMFINAEFGPLVLKNVGFTGTYSTDPSVLQNFSITGTLGINAFAILGLEAEAGVGVTLLGHDVKAGVNVTAAAGLRTYAEATPTFEYKEAKAPEGGKVGESRLKGHFEAAAQLFLQLSGSLFYELDSPWWSPAPDGREDFPLGEVQYPIGDSMGIGADVDWLVGSPDAPELKFSPVEFDPNKFTADVMADPPPRKIGKSDQNPAGEWKGEGKGDTSKQKDPKANGKGKGLPENNKKKEDLKKLPDQQKYMRALDEMSKLEKAKPKPTHSVVAAKAKKIKAKYGLEQIQVRGGANSDKALIYVKHKKENNSKPLLKIPLMNVTEAVKLRNAAMLDLRVREKKAAGEGSTIEESGATVLITTWKKAHPIVESAKVVDGKTTWDYFVDFGDKSNTEKGKRKKGNIDTKGLKAGDGEIGEVVPFKVGKEDHKVWVRATSGKIDVMVASTLMTVDAKILDWNTRLSTLGVDDQKKAKVWLENADNQHKVLKQKADLANNAKKAAEEKSGDKALTDAFIKIDNEVEQLERIFKQVLAELFKVFGDENGEISFNEKLVEAYFVTNDKGKKRKRRIYLVQGGTSYRLNVEADNPKTYREFINSIDISKNKKPDEAKTAKAAAEPILGEIEAIIKAGAPKGYTDKQKKEYLKKEKPKKIDKEAEKLVPYTKILFEREGEVPESTDPKYGALSSNPLIGSSMEVEKLTKKGEQGSVPTTAAHDVYDVLYKRQKGKKAYYVKGHLLNHHVHGPGSYKNLTPLSIDGNSAHLNNAENSVKVAVSSGAVVYYKVEIGGGTYAPSIPDKAEMDAAGIEEKNQSDLQEIRKTEKYVPRYLVVTAYNLKEDANGDFTKKEPIFQNKKIDNHIDTDLDSYQFDRDGANSKTRIVLTVTDPTTIVKETGVDLEVLKVIINIFKVKKGLRSLKNLKMYLEESSSYDKDDKLTLSKTIEKLELYDNLQIRNYKK
ncbi:eCIS core domain-containing protein [Aquimarina agarivorans]|uniref:eCIS core domain-containing protein n=1 Tax=Aquimarina agarivorans TaxID=980584 RepID=UPI000248F2C6|nr:DUF4157 domain-containing protein [Aquimarina agarivorans]